MLAWRFEISPYDLTLPECGGILLGESVAYNFQPTQTTCIPQLVYLVIPKNSNVFGSECDNKISVMAAD